MDQQEQPFYVQGTLLTTHFSHAPQSGKRRTSRSFAVLVLMFGLLTGILIGALGTLFYVSSTHDVFVPPSQSVPSEAAIIVQLSPTYLSQIVTKEVNQTNIPGSFKNIQVTMVHSASITLSGDDQLSLMGFSVTNHMLMQLQPAIHTCQLQVSITHADINGIAINSFVSSFEHQINQQLANNSKNSSLPQGFTYCATNVRTETNGIFVTYSAKPI
jgi:hypothetical protein